MSEHDPFHWRDAARYRPEVNDPERADKPPLVRPPEVPAPRERSASDDELVAQGIAEARERGLEGIVDDRTARIIASQFHSGQSSDLYAFASSGCIDKEELAAELFACIMEVDPNDEAANAALEALCLYILETEDRDAVPGWAESTRW